MSELEPKQIQRTNSGSVIVFDPTTQTLTTEKKKRLRDQKPTSQKRAPKVASRVDIYDDSEPSRLVVTLNLGKLGWATTTKRLFGKCNQIYVMELPDGMAPPLLTAS